MRSATRQALASGIQALRDLGEDVDLSTAQDLFSVCRVLGDSAQLRAAITDPSADAALKSALATRLFGERISEQATGLVGGIAKERWAEKDDILVALEELGIRAAAMSVPAGTAVEEELFSFAGIVASDADLELALGSKLGRPDSKAELVEALLSGKVSDATLAIVRHLVVQPRGRSVREALRTAESVVADEAGLAIATVTVATGVNQDQLDGLTAGLSERYGKELKVNVVINPDLIGGMRVQVGDDVIDGSIATRINELRLRLAG